MTGAIDLVVFITVSAIAAAIFVLLFRYALRWHWTWAFPGGIILFLTLLLPWTPFGIASRVFVSLGISVSAAFRLHAHLGLRWTYAVAIGIAVFCLLATLDMPIQTHAVKLDFPPSH